MSNEESKSDVVKNSPRDRLGEIQERYRDTVVFPSRVYEVQANDFAWLIQEVELLRSLNQRVMKAIEWQPIETVPKDGTEVLLAHGNSQWIDQWVEFEDGAACWMMCDQREETELPSHWKRLGELPPIQAGG